MRRTKKIFIGIIITIIGITITFNTFYGAGISLFPEEFVIKSKIIKELDVKRDEIFDVMSDLENYPKIFPDNILSLKILNQTENTIIAEEKVTERGIITKLVVKHTIIPKEMHSMEILEGDAKGSMFTVLFQDHDGGAKLTLETELHLRGKLIPIGIFTQYSLESVVDTIITNFVDYAKRSK